MSTTWTPGPDDELDLADLAATDAWLDAVASRTGGADPLAAQLIGWLDRIDDEHQPAPAVEIVAAAADVAPVVDLRSPSGTSRRMPRRALAAVAILSVTTLAGAGVAAASPGTPLYPVHRVVFGAADQQALDRASSLLDQSAAIITSAQVTGQISASQRAAATRLLGQAAGLLDHAPASSHQATLERRLQGLTASLAALVTPAPTPAVIVPSVHATPAPTSGSGSGKGSGGHDTSGDSGKQSGKQSGSDDKSGTGDDSSGKSGSGSGEDTKTNDKSGDTSGDSSGKSGDSSGDGSGDRSGSGDSGHQSGSGDGSGGGSGDSGGDSGGGSGGGSGDG